MMKMGRRKALSNEDLMDSYRIDIINGGCEVIQRAVQVKSI